MRKVFASFIMLTVVTLLATACVLQEPEEASAPIEAIPLAAEPEAGGSETDSDSAASESDSAPAENMVQVYEIVQADSEARFELDEELRGELNTVVGSTDQVAGQIALSYDDLATAEVGTIQLDARTLATDNSRRDGTMKRFILNTDDFEFITFEPGEVIGLPESVEVGETVEFTMVGDLTIRDVSNEVEFAVVATLASVDRLEGSASASVSRGDYGLQIPSLPHVANVDEDVKLYIDFVAVAV
jgi:polyisoprenoid-binding protein YceI